MRVFCLCVYSFVICWSHLIVFGAHFFILLSLGRLWASFWEPLGRLGLPRGPPWRHFGPPLAPLGLRGAIWGTLGSQGELGMTLVQNGRPIPSKWLSSSAPAHKKRARGNQCLQCLQRLQPPKWRKSRSSQSHFTRAGGQDDVSLEQTPSKY